MTKPRALTLLLVALFALALGARGYFFFTSAFFVPTTTDEAIAFLMAQAIALGERPLLVWGTPYQFPFESYLMAPFVSVLGTTAFGSRILLAVIGVTSVGGFSILLKRAFKPDCRIIGYLLIGFPSAYVVTLQSAYFIPQYTMTLTYSWLIPLLASFILGAQRAPSWALIGLGSLCGFALANHLLSLPLAIVTIAAICIGPHFRGALRHSSLFIPSFIVGLIPYFLTLHSAHTAAQKITGSHPLWVTLQRFFSPLLNYNLSTVLGFTVTLFPDYGQWEGFFPSLVPVGLSFFWAMLLTSTIIAGTAFIRRSLTARWLTVSFHDLLIGTTWVCLIAYAASLRGRPGEYRYLLPVAWYFPFLMAYLYEQRSKTLKTIIAVTTCAIVSVNLVHIRAVINAWQEEGFNGGQRDLYDIYPVINYLDNHGITHCYASFWYVNRFPFETNNRITCSQPYNERFAGWPMRYKDIVDKSENAAYVLTNTAQARFRATKFQQMLAHHSITYKLKRIGHFHIFHSFRFNGARHSHEISKPTLLTDSMVVIDGDLATTWTSFRQKDEDAILRIDLLKPTNTHRITLRFPLTGSLSKRPFSIESTADGTTWQTVRQLAPAHLSQMYLTTSHPIFTSERLEDVLFEPRKTIAFRITVPQSKNSKVWELSEVDIYQSKNRNK